MSAAISGDKNSTKASDLLSDIEEDEPVTKPKQPRKPAAPFTPDAAVLESITKAFTNKGAFTVPRAFATAADARKSTNLLNRHAVIAAEAMPLDPQRTAARKIVQLTDDYRATHAKFASATNDQWRVTFQLTKTRPPKADKADAAKAEAK